MRLNNWQHELLAMRQDGQIIAGASMYRKAIPLLGHFILSIPFGPVWAYSTHQDCRYFVDIIDEMIIYARRAKAVFIEVDAYQPGRASSRDGMVVTSPDYLLTKKKFDKTGKKFGTYVVDITPSEESIFNNFKKNHRRDIRKAIREKVRITVNSKLNTGDMVSRFYTYYLNTFKRKGLAPHSPEFFSCGIRQLLEDDLCKMFIAEFNGTIYNMAIISLFGMPAYVWGASLPMSNLPPTGELLHWEIIRWLKKEGYRSYDLGGSPGPVPDPKDHNYGVWRFKHGFRGEYRERYVTYAAIINTPLYFMYRRFMPYFRVLRDRMISSSR